MTASHYQIPPEQEGPGPVGYLALVLAWAVPGLGHMVIGQRARGLIFAVVIHGLFAAGLLLGGIRSINPPEQPIWTYTQFLTGWPMLAANRVEHSVHDDLQQMYQSNSDYVRERLPGDTADELTMRQQRVQKFIAEHPIFAFHPKVQDIGAVYCGIAGMLNLLVMFDVLLRITGSVREDAAASKRRTASGAGPLPAAAGTESPR